MQQIQFLDVPWPGQWLICENLPNTPIMCSCIFSQLSSSATDITKVKGQYLSPLTGW